MDQIRETLGRISELSDDELTQLSESIVAEFESVNEQELSPQVVESMTELAEAIDAVNAEKSRRQEEVAELSRRRDEAAERFQKAGEPAVVEEGEDPSDEDDEDKDKDPVQPAPEPATEASADETPAETESKPATELATDEVAEETTDAPTELSVENPDTPGFHEKAAAPDNTLDLENTAPAADATSTNSGGDSTQVKPDTLQNKGEEAAKMEGSGTADGTSTGAEDSADDAAEPAAEDADNTEENNSGEDSEASVTAAATEGPDVQAPADRRPQPKATATVSIVAGADIPSITAGSSLPNMRAIAEAMTARMHGMRRSSGGDGEQHTVASLVASFPEDRVLRAGEPDANKDKIEKVASPEAITAAGGFCAPLEVDYEVFGFGTTNRPVKDSLASFQADRGGIRWTDAPVLGDLDEAVSVWTLQDDIDASTEGAPNPTKPCLRVLCGGEQTAIIDAIPLCLTFGNLQSRAFPEQVEANNNLALVTFARFAEQRLLTRIGALSTQVSAARKLGVARDLLNQVDRAAVAYRNRHRMNETDTLRVILPTWIKNAIRADLVNNMPGDGRDDNFNLADSKINAWFSVRHINVSWTIDGEAGQIFGAQAAGALLEYPDNVIWYLFAEGTFLFLDGGNLDLGLVRDSTLNSTNDYKMFVETFEGVAKRGIESLRVTSPFETNGAVAGTVDPATLV